MMECPKCSFEQEDTNQECIQCGIIFEKFYLSQHKAEETSSVATETPVEPEKKLNASEILKELLFQVQPETNPIIFWSRVAFYLLLIGWGIKFMVTPLETNYTAASFWHLINLPFHEAGHIIFRPFGRFITSLGGSLFQVLMPIICMSVFLIKTRDPFAASFCVWWTGENFMDLSPYINDARSLTLPLLGGNIGRTSPYGFHDWEFILKESGLARYDHVFAHASYRLGACLMIVAFIWGGYLLYRQYGKFRKIS